MRRARPALLLLVLLASGCIKVPSRVKASFCAQRGARNHFGTGIEASSCCPGPPRVVRFGVDEGACAR